MGPEPKYNQYGARIYEADQLDDRGIPKSGQNPLWRAASTVDAIAIVKRLNELATAVNSLGAKYLSPVLRDNY